MLCTGGGVDTEAHFPNLPPPWPPCRNRSYKVPAGVVFLFKGTLTHGQFRMPSNAPPRRYYGTMEIGVLIRPALMSRWNHT